MRTAWATIEPGCTDFGAVLIEVNSSKLISKGSVLERGAHVPINDMGYFKPPQDAFLSEMRAKDRRSDKEWESVNAAGVWTETGLVAMELAMEDESVDVVARRLKLARSAFKESLEVLSMRAQYFRDITEQRVEIQRKMYFLLEQGNDAVFSKT